MKIDKLILGMPAAAALLCVGVYFFVFNFFVYANSGVSPRNLKIENTDAVKAKNEISFAFVGNSRREAYQTEYDIVRSFSDAKIIGLINNFDEQEVTAGPHFYSALISVGRQRELYPLI